MKIEFSKFDYNTLNNYRGGKGNLQAKIVLEANKKIMNIILKPSQSIGEHIHEFDEELIYILDGVATITEEDEVYTLNKGDMHISKCGRKHSLRNDSDQDLNILSIVTKIKY